MGLAHEQGQLWYVQAIEGRKGVTRLEQCILSNRCGSQQAGCILCCQLSGKPSVATSLTHLFDTLHSHLNDL